MGALVQIVEEYNMVGHTEGTVAHIKTASCFQLTSFGYADKSVIIPSPSHHLTTQVYSSATSMPLYIYPHKYHNDNTPLLSDWLAVCLWVCAEQATQRTSVITAIAMETASLAKFITISCPLAVQCWYRYHSTHKLTSLTNHTLFTMLFVWHENTTR